ncbi:serine-threonine protein kinase 19, partial [Phialemonium atrogriseum]
PRRRGVGEAFVLATDLEAMVRRAGPALDDAARDAFVAFLARNPAAVRVPRVVAAAEGRRRRCGDGEGEGEAPVPGLSRAQTDQLVRAGFLTAQHTGHDAGNATGAFSRPEDRYSLMSLEAVSQAASGSMGAVGGEGALHAAGGSGAGRGGGPSVDLVSGTGDLSLAVPGHGAYLKLVSSALEHLSSLLEKSQYREAPETALRERWDGGVASDEAALAKRSRGEFVGILPGRTKKWKEFHGLSFDWILQEAVGAGLVEVFETRSVGRGVRLV